MESSFDPPKRKGLEEDLGLRLARVGETHRRKCSVIWHVSQLELMFHKEMNGIFVLYDPHLVTVHTSKRLGVLCDVDRVFPPL